MTKLRIGVSCYMYVGAPKWRHGAGDWVYEPDECGWEGEIIVDKWDWEHDQCDQLYEFRCPECGALLEDDSHFEVEEEVKDDSTEES